MAAILTNRRRAHYILNIHLFEQLSSEFLIIGKIRSPPSCHSRFSSATILKFVFLPLLPPLLVCQF